MEMSQAVLYGDNVVRAAKGQEVYFYEDHGRPVHAPSYNDLFGYISSVMATARARRL